MDTTYYDRLQAVAELSLDDSAERQRFQQMIDYLEDYIRSVSQATEQISIGLRGQTGDALCQVLSSITRTAYETTSGAIIPGWVQHMAARQAMQVAKDQFQSLSPTLVEPSFWGYIAKAGELVFVQGVGPMEALDYLKNLENYQNSQREERAKQILTNMDTAIRNAESRIPRIDRVPVQWPSADEIKTPIPAPDPGSSGGGSTGGGSTGGLGGFSGFDPLPSGGTMSGMSGVTPGSITSDGYMTGLGVDPNGYSWSGGSSGLGGSSGSGAVSVDTSSSGASGGIAWGMLPVLVANGPAGGVLPAPVTNQFDPSWKTGYSVVPGSVGKYVPGSGIGGTGSMSGWTTASGMSASGVSLPGSTGGGTGSGVGFAGGAGGVGGTGSLSSASGIGGAGSSSGSGAGGGRSISGLGGSGSMGASGAAGESAGAAGGSRGGMMAPGAGGGSSKEEKLKRRKYKVLKFKGDPRQEDLGELPWAAGPGCVEDIPVRRPPEEEEGIPW